MRLIDLSEEFEDVRAAESQADAAERIFGSQADGLGSRVARIEAIEGDGTEGVNGKGGNGLMTYHPTLSQLKQYLFRRFGGGNGQAANSPYILLGRD